MKSLCPPFLVVSGPTASGKSSLSVMLARYFSREVINVDSVQIYRGLEVGSAQISPEDQQGVRHHLIGELEINVPIDAKWYCDQIMSMTNSLQAEGKGSVLCVGTNLYLLSLLYGLAELPQGDGELRNQLEQESTVVLYERLKECDPRASENIHPHDKVRIIRALEVAHLSQDSLSEAHHIHQATLDPSHALILILIWNRQALYERINSRTASMVSSGLVEEVKEVVNRYGQSFPAGKSIGYAEVLSSLNSGDEDLSGLIDSIAQSTRRFAKRQLTFWRNEPRKRGWEVSPSSDEGKQIGQEVSIGGKPRKAEGFSVHSYSFNELCERVSERLQRPFSCSEVWHLDAERLFSSTFEHT